MTCEKRKFIHISLTLLLSLLLSDSWAQNYVPIDKGMKIEFSLDKARGTAGKIRGKFSNITGSIHFDPRHPESSLFDITLKASAVGTGDKYSDMKLMTEHFLSVIKFPSIRLLSTSVKKESSGSELYSLMGMLTIKGITQPVHMTYTATPTGDGYFFRGMIMINRLDFGIGSKGEMGEQVAVFVEVKAKRK